MHPRSHLARIFIYGAIGDALGAGIEKWSLTDIDAFFSDPKALTYTRQTRPNQDATKGNAGDVTDDTAMSMCVMAALNKGMSEALKTGRNIQLDGFAQHIYQSFLYWAKSQKTYAGIDGTPCEAFIHDRDWPELDAFKNTYGAGNSTILALNSGQMGTQQRLAEIPATPGVARNSKYAAGCAPLMRVAAIGVLAAHFDQIDAFAMGCESAVITHGDATAYLAAGLFAELLAKLLRQNMTLSKALQETISFIEQRLLFRLKETERLGYQQCLIAINIAFAHLNDRGQYENDIVDKVGLACQNNLFSTMPIFAQVLFVALATEKHRWEISKALRFAVRQSGDSDSVGSITGNLLGAMCSIKHTMDIDLLNGLNTGHKAAIYENFNTFMNLIEKLEHPLTEEYQYRPRPH